MTLKSSKRFQNLELTIAYGFRITVIINFDWLFSCTFNFIPVVVLYVVFAMWDNQLVDLKLKLKGDSENGDWFSGDNFSLYTCQLQRASEWTHHLLTAVPVPSPQNAFQEWWKPDAHFHLFVVRILENSINKKASVKIKL